MAEPFDLDALDVDTADQPFTFRWNGQVFTMATFKQMEWRRQIEFDNVPLVDAMRELVGNEQFEALNEKPMSRGRFNQLLDAWYEYQGIDRGEGRASSNS